MGLFSRDKPKIKVQTTKSDGYSGWLKCTHCQELIHQNELERNLNCCHKCDYHYRLSTSSRIANLTDEGSFKEIGANLRPTDPLKFVDTEAYSERLANADAKSENSESAIAGICQINGREIALGIMDFNFMGGSLGSVSGERLTLLIEAALQKRIPLIIISASGGARMQESIFSLMQMAKTSAALARFHEAKLPYFSVLTNPTTGGVTASFASLGDIILAEPNALICFAGPRVIEQTIGQKLPPGAQKSEFLLSHGMVDRIVRRQDLKNVLSQLLSFFPCREMPNVDTVDRNKAALEALRLAAQAVEESV